MKPKVFFSLMLLILSTFLYISDTTAENEPYTQWKLPAGAKARLGKGGINDITCSSDGALLAVASKIGIWIYDIQTGEELSLLTRHTRSVDRIAFSPDGRTFASGGQDNTLRLWDVECYVKDDISGFEKGYIVIRDPLGGEQGYDFVGPYTYIHTKEIYFQDDPNVYRKYNRRIYLPEGSFPGVWGVIGIGVTDKARNTIYHDFTEITRFEVTETQSAPTVQVTLPDKNALLPNYPNPSNPETWIPYQLAKPADVKLTIYAADGKFVRLLVLGHQDAGIYQSRNRAVYWDGKNALGESVASGMYFYTLTADNFSATRKMLIKK